MNKKLFSAAVILFLAASLISGEVVRGGKTWFTSDDLMKYDGKNGKPQYIAVDGVVYDMTGVAPWSKGSHKGGKAGEDISEKILKAPHGKSVLKKREVKGYLVEAFTLKQLEQYGPGSTGKRYISVDGLVYDITDVPAWKEGFHKGNKSGEDLSEKILKAPHGKKVLETLKVAGILTD